MARRAKEGRFDVRELVGVFGLESPSAAMCDTLLACKLVNAHAFGRKPKAVLRWIHNIRYERICVKSFQFSPLAQRLDIPLSARPTVVALANLESHPICGSATYTTALSQYN
jgi:hypothetical protein